MMPSEEWRGERPGWQEISGWIDKRYTQLDEKLDRFLMVAATMQTDITRKMSADAFYLFRVDIENRLAKLEAKSAIMGAIAGLLISIAINLLFKK